MPAGRPTKYKPEFAKQAERLCELGATDRELSDFFEVSEDSIHRWRIEHKEFGAALKAGKDAADDRVELSLYRRAIGYSHDAVKIVADAKSGEHVVVPYVEHYPPDTTAAIFWLKNRRRKEWRDKHDVEHSVSEDLAAIMDSRGRSDR